MKVTVTFSIFRQSFEDQGRLDNWSLDGLRALFEHIEDTYDEDIELDVQELDGTYAEYDSARAACDDNGIKYSMILDDDEEEDEYEIEADALCRLKKRMTAVIEFPGGVVTAELQD